MKIVVACLLLSFVKFSISQQCSDNFAEYLGCLKDNHDANYIGLEQEYQDDYKKEVTYCFAQSIPDARKLVLCTLLPHELEYDAFGSEGPLSPCPTCQEFGRSLKASLSNVSNDEIQCFGSKIREALGKEMTQCMKGKLDFDYKYPALPNFDEAGYKNRQDMLKTMSYLINVNSRVAFCKRTELRHENTKECLEKRPAGFLKKHCSINVRCKSQFKGDAKCFQQFNKIQTASCQCVAEKRSEIKNLINNLGGVLKNTLEGKIGDSSCVKEVSENLKSKTTDNDWKVVISQSMNQCFRDAPKVGVEQMIEAGCKRAVEQGKDGAKDVLIGINFVLNLFDSFVERQARFCPGDHCIA